MVALVAPSGAGKSTLLHIAGLLERPDAGEVFIAGQPTSHAFRRRAHGAPPHRRSASSISSIISCRSSPRSRTSCMPQLIPGLAATRRRSGAGELLAYLRVEQRADAPAGRAFRRRAAARRHRPRRRQRAARAPRRRADRQSRPENRRPRLRRAEIAGARSRTSPRSSPPTTHASPPAWTAPSPSRTAPSCRRSCPRPTSNHGGCYRKPKSHPLSSCPDLIRASIP